MKMVFVIGVTVFKPSAPITSLILFLITYFAMTYTLTNLQLLRRKINGEKT